MFFIYKQEVLKLKIIDTQEILNIFSGSLVQALFKAFATSLENHSWEQTTSLS